MITILLGPTITQDLLCLTTTAAATITTVDTKTTTKTPVNQPFHLDTPMDLHFQDVNDISLIIRSLFGELGNITDVILFKYLRNLQEDGCFVKYANIEDAAQAIVALHHQYTFPGLDMLQPQRSKNDHVWVRDLASIQVQVR